MFSLLCGRDGLTCCFQEKNSRANMAAMAKLWRFISPERIGFFLQKLEVLFASCYSIQNIFLRIFKVTGSGQTKMAQMSHFGTTAWCLPAGCFWLAEAFSAETKTVWNCIIFDVLNVLTWFPIAQMSAIVCCMSSSWATHVEMPFVTWVSFSVQTLLLSQPANAGSNDFGQETSRWKMEMAD